MASSGLICSDGSTEHSTAGGVSGEQSGGRESGSGQDTVGFLGCESTLLGHVELLTNQRPKSSGLVSVLQEPAGDCPGSHAGNIIKYHEVYLPLIFTALLI